MQLSVVKATACVCFVISLAQAPAFPHHSLAMYNMTNPVTVKGVVTRVEWTNPHVHLFVNVQDGKGSVEEWAIEMDPPDFLMRNGWTSTTVKPGDVVIFTGAPAKNGARSMRCTTVELANGEKLRS
jgi:DNA/RNA endonuclease YhcR with UshA esterase domain